jgi:large subunit ribosomal protein L18
MLTKKEQRLRRARSTRIRISELKAVRLTVNRTNLHIYAQVIPTRHRCAGQRVDHRSRSRVRRSEVPARVATSPLPRWSASALPSARSAQGIEKVAFDRSGSSLPRPYQGAG